MMTTELAEALERAALALRDAATTLRGTTATPVPSTAPGAGRRCPCGAPVEFREWTSKAGKPCRAHKCTASRQGEDHFIEWVK